MKPADDKQPITVLFDRVMVQISQTDGERRSRAGILIPATAQISRRLTWAEAVAVGPHVRTVKVGDTVLFNPEDRFEVEVHGEEYVILRERDIHAIAFAAQRQRNGPLPVSAVGSSAAPEGIALTVDDDLVAVVDFAKDADGLVPAIVQDANRRHGLDAGLHGRGGVAPDPGHGAVVVLQPQPPGVLAEGGDVRRPAVRARGPRRL